MTPVPVDIEQEVILLVKSHPEPQAKKLEKYMKRLDRMRNFYADKAPDAPEAQAQMFNGFVKALFYAETTIKIHRQLTRRLAELVKDDRI